MSIKSAAVLMSCVALFTAPGLGARGQLTAQGDPLSKLVGDWDLTVFVMGGGRFAGPRCGKSDRPGPPAVTIAPPGDSGVALAVACNDGSDYAFRLKHDQTTQAYVLTVKSKVGISVQDFPVVYVVGQGWQGKRDQLVAGEMRSITAMVAPIRGWEWYGWKVVVLPTASIGHEGLLEKPFFRVDLTRRKP